MRLLSAEDQRGGAYWPESVRKVAGSEMWQLLDCRDRRNVDFCGAVTNHHRPFTTIFVENDREPTTAVVASPRRCRHKRR